MLNISPEHLIWVKTILKQQIPDLTVLAFGSRVKGTARAYSDLDLAIMTQTPLRIDQYSALKYAFSESNLPFQVDIVDWASISDEFKTIIQKEAIEIQK